MMAPTRRDLRGYVQLLFEELAKEWSVYHEQNYVNKMKKYMIYIAQGIDAEFEQQIRRVQTEADFFAACDAFMDSDELLTELPPENSKLFCGFKDLLH
jgi:tRNA-dihydrouridine synthase C